MGNPTPRERAEQCAQDAKGKGATHAELALAEARVWALLDVADAIRELPERSR